jgi:hypothetical protein
MKEATINAKQAGERGISAKSVKKVTEVSHTQCWIRFMELRIYLIDVPVEVQRLSWIVDGAELDSSGKLSRIGYQWQQQFIMEEFREWHATRRLADVDVVYYGHQTARTPGAGPVRKLRGLHGAARIFRS